MPFATLAAQSPHSLATPDFQRDIRPILASHCLPCHGPDGAARKAELRLDRFEFATAARDGGAAIVPGDPARSVLWQRITASDADEVMPPPAAHKPLDASQRERLRAWIADGARYAEHWAFVAPRKAALPTAPDGAVLAPIDAFVRAELRARGIAASPPADRATLLRRVTLDLTGLPPSGDEVAAFVADPAPDAYERVVDRLLQSPHCAERLALPWLDAARFADTNGFSIDGGRQAWPWRDYVLQSFLTNKPYDRFLLEQIAGDLLPDRSDETLVATGFQRNAMITHEGGTIAEENLVNYGVDRTRTFGEAVLGLTVGCAQCHDHKFDPISQREYYALFAFFNQTSEPAHGGDGGVNPAPTADLKSVLVTGEEAALQARIDALRAQLASPDAAAVAAWEAEQRVRLATAGRDLAQHRATPTSIITPNTGSGFRIADDGFAVVERAMSALAFDVAMELPPIASPITGLRIVMHPDPERPQEGLGFGAVPAEGEARRGASDCGGGSAATDVSGHDGEPRTFVLTHVSVSAGAVRSDQVDLYELLELSRATASSWRETAAGKERPEGVLDTLAATGWMPDPASAGPAHLTVTFRTPLPAGTRHLTAQLHFGRHGSLTARRMEFFAITGEDDGSELPPAIRSLVAAGGAERSAERQRAVERFAVRHGDAFRRARIDLANAEQRLAARTRPVATMVMDTAETPRATHVLHRGVYDQPREVVTAGVPAVLPPLPACMPADRLALARWVTDPRHPLTARVAVNRFWQMLFGTGLVRTAADFGAQGEPPSHPELLDWLAVDFVEHGYDVRALLRQIVTSATYRQSAVVDAAQRARDPDNRWLARGPRFRLPAELVRDVALATSGLLVRQLGGPSVNPYTPGDPWREISHFGSSSATAQSFVQDHGDKLWRRSLYTYWKRTLPPPTMALFDAPNREVCVVDRGATNTPLQALVLLNEVAFVEAARAFAQRTLQRPGDDAARLGWAFVEATSRTPTQDELAVLARALQRERAQFAATPDAARRLLAHGEAPRDESIAPGEHAAWAQVAALLLNLSEAVIRP